MSHITRIVKSKSVYMKDLNSIILRHFLRGRPNNEAKSERIDGKSYMQHYNPKPDNIE